MADPLDYLPYALAAHGGTVDGHEAGAVDEPRGVDGPRAEVVRMTQLYNPPYLLLAEDGSGDLVVRLYESLGGRAQATVTAEAEVGSVNATDLLERPLPDGAASEGASIDLELRPFHLVTLRFRR